MPSGLIALLDDVGLAVGKAGTKAAGVVIDDTAVTPRYVVGLAPERELPIIGKIAWGSLKNKLVILLPAALLLSLFLPVLITPLLMIGGAYLAFEATEKIIEAVAHDHHHEEQVIDALDDPAELEKMQVAGAIRTDFILSAEIMAIALAELEADSFGMQAAALAAVAVAITVAVYGVVGLIVKLDDMGLHLAKRRDRGSQALGRGLVHGVPWLLRGLSILGTAAMLWVGGGIIIHGLEEMHILEAVPHLIHDNAHAVAGGFAALEWLANALGAAIVGAIVGAPIVALVHMLKKRKAAPAAA